MLRSGVGALLQGEGPVSLSLRPDQLIAHWLMQFIAACHPKRARDVEPFLAELGRQGLAHHAKAATRIGYKVQFEGILEAVGKRLPVGELQHEAARAVELVVRAQVLSRAELLALELALNSETCQGAGATILRRHEVQSVRKIDSQRVEVVAGDKTPVRTHKMIAQQVVLAACVWTDSLTKVLQHHLPMNGGKGYSVL